MVIVYVYEWENGYEEGDELFYDYDFDCFLKGKLSVYFYCINNCEKFFDCYDGEGVYG